MVLVHVPCYATVFFKDRTFVQCCFCQTAFVRVASWNERTILDFGWRSNIRGRVYTGIRLKILLRVLALLKPVSKRQNIPRRWRPGGPVRCVLDAPSPRKISLRYRRICL